MRATSKRAQELGTENAFVVLGEIGKLQAEGKDIVSFCIGQPDFQTPENICNAAIQAIRDGHHGYTPSPGIPPLREAVAGFFSRTRGITVDPDDVVVACGGKPFIGYTILSVTDHGAGHEVIFPNPGFPIYKSQIDAHGAVAVPLNLRESKEFNFDLDDLRSKVNENTRMLILCSPGNPTAGVLSRAELEEIASIVEPFENLWIYSDEVYSGLVYDGDFQSISNVPGMQERTIIADSASKTFAMTGWRIGYAANRALAPVFTRWVTNTDSCPPHPNQWGVVEALNGPQDAPLAMRDTFLKRRDKIVDGLNEIEGFRCLRPKGAFYVWPNVTEACAMVGAADSEEFRKRLLYEAGVAVLADIHFGVPVVEDGWHIRFSYASSFEAIDEGLGRVRDFMTRNKR
jgi:aspartate/methionine/tyrosine aminotransferase